MMENKKRYHIALIEFILLVFLVVWLSPAAAVGSETIIKVALITPEGSPWTNSLYKLADDIRQRTGGSVSFVVYAGGISGDETDVLRKMQANRIQAAGFSGVGLGILVPKIRILEAPLLYKNYDEVDLVKSRLKDQFAVEFEKKGYVLLGFAEAGFVYLFSSESMTGPEAFGPLKMWVWKGDPVAKSSMNTLGIKTYPLQLTDVNTGLETGMINAFYAPPAAAIAYQWHAKVKYMLDYPLVNSTGAFLIKKSTFEFTLKGTPEGVTGRLGPLSVTNWFRYPAGSTRKPGRPLRLPASYLRRPPKLKFNCSHPKPRKYTTTMSIVFIHRNFSIR